MAGSGSFINHPRPSVPKLFRNQRDALRLAKDANDFVELMYGDPKNPRVVYPPEKAKRAAPVRDPLIPSEHQSQAAVISWWALACNAFGLPRFALFAIPNGGARDPITGARLKAEGVRPGVPDLMLAVKRNNCCGLFIEMKKRGNNPTPAQQEVLTYLHDAGYGWGVCWDADEAIAKITNYINL